MRGYSSTRSSPDMPEEQNQKVRPHIGSFLHVLILVIKEFKTDLQVTMGYTDPKIFTARLPCLKLRKHCRSRGGAGEL